ncbi:glycosyltransferase family 9 protein [Sphingomonas sp. BIUV-7]|uniref:Glycosyltransferase family 9 protein n=1 Tax=Sphingomonas natans TaxID=3063330 RepID=A0ABT8Y5Q6_9SPHN|nr:glycosyltransferase family 9 protein [Sphingomonas sp. BIUV-7]MDO6413662.1 glycosyltransferase family 9 protein [Sphingomonas sp. BIUV-7]
MPLIPKFIPQRRLARELVARANERRDAGRFLEAAALYVEALRFLPHRGDLHVQAGHMFKEGGDLARAEQHYRSAERLMPEDADLALQFGHFLKVAGRREEAVTSYQRALSLRPEWTEVREELVRLDGLSDQPATYAETVVLDVGAEAAALSASLGFTVQRDLLPRPPAELLHAHREGIEIRSLGRSERSNWGTRRTLRGVEAVRGFCISPTPLVEVLILVNGIARHRGPLDGGHEIKREKHRPELMKYIFNAWIDFSLDLPGRYDVGIRITDVKNRRYTHHEEIVIQPALTEAQYPQLDGIVEIDAGDPRPIEQQINERPSQIRSARRALLAEAPRTILVQRIDQLGDMVVSVPALRRLRSLFPEARIVGLVSNANRDLASDLGLFDEVLVTDFPEDWDQRRRIMPLEKQRELVEMFKPYRFDMAIDMSENGWARRVLLLSGAPFLYGFRAGDDVPGLSLDLEGNTHDRWNGYEVVPHTNKMLGMMEWLGALARSEPNVVRRTHPSDEALASLGLRPGRRYAVVHDGARLLFSRWPYFNALAEAILRETDLDVVMLRDDQSKGPGLSAELENSGRFSLMPPRLSYDAFDALLANCAVFAGNDSGPKHLASLRGAEVVSIHMARTNWNEWGQESSGYIISRKVPCAGCMIHYDAEECGADFVCLRNITTAEVMQAIKTVLAESVPLSDPARSEAG